MRIIKTSRKYRLVERNGVYSVQRRYWFFFWTTFFYTMQGEAYAIEAFHDFTPNE